MEFARRVQYLPPYLFAEIDIMINEAKARGVDVISFGIGDPDQPTSEHIVQKMIQAVQKPANHNYPAYSGMDEFRQAIVDFYQKRFGVQLDPSKEVLALIGSKEGIAHLPLCLLNPGDIALIPDPGYPVYKTATIISNGIPYLIPLIAENQYLPDLKMIDRQIAQRAKLMYLNYPNNPTGAVATRRFFEQVVSFASEHDIYLAHDAAYAELGFDGYLAPSILEIPKAKEIAVEFYSLSKTYNMTGWRIGTLVGNAEIIEAVGRIKSNIDSGIFQAIQWAGIEALKGPQDSVTEVQKLYKSRHDLTIKNLQDLGWKMTPNQATFYLWIPVPHGMKSDEFSKMVFRKTGVFFTPGIGYGHWGEGYVRLSLTLSEERILEAFQRLKDKEIRFN